MTIEQSIIAFVLKEPFWALIIFLFVIHWLNHWIGKLFALPFRKKKRSDTPHKQKRTLSKTVEKSSQITSLTVPKQLSSESSLNDDGYIEIKVKEEQK